jgi:hypothetical protein
MVHRPPRRPAGAVTPGTCRERVRAQPARVAPAGCQHVLFPRAPGLGRRGHARVACPGEYRGTRRRALGSAGAAAWRRARPPATSWPGPPWPLSASVWPAACAAGLGPAAGSAFPGPGLSRLPGRRPCRGRRPWTDPEFAARVGQDFLGMLDRLEADAAVREVVVLTHVPVLHCQLLPWPDAHPPGRQGGVAGDRGRRLSPPGRPGRRRAGCRHPVSRRAPGPGRRRHVRWPVAVPPYCDWPRGSAPPPCPGSGGGDQVSASSGTAGTAGSTGCGSAPTRGRVSRSCPTGGRPVRS